MIFISNKYSRIYFEIVNNSKNRDLTNIYTELHHIVPKSLGGDDSSNNLIKLTAREHFICHWLLTKMVNDLHKPKMIFAFTLMLKCKSKHQDRYRNKLTSRLYEKYKIIDSNLKKTLYKGKSRNKTKYKFCHIDGRTEYCSILEISQKHQLLRSSLGHLVKKTPGKHHVKGWSIDFPMKTIDRNKLYTGSGGPTYDFTIYTFVHKDGKIEKCTKYDLFTKYTLSRNGIYAMCSGIQKTSQGWSLLI